jgi:hypothetical protein
VPEASEAFNSESSMEIQLEGAKRTIEWRLAKLKRDLKGNPFKVVVDLVDQENEVGCVCLRHGGGDVDHAIYSKVFRIPFSFRSMLLYCYFRKVSAIDDGTEDLKKKLAEAERKKPSLKRLWLKRKRTFDFSASTRL